MQAAAERRGTVPVTAANRRQAAPDVAAPRRGRVDTPDGGHGVRQVPWRAPSAAACTSRPRVSAARAAVMRNWFRPATARPPAPAPYRTVTATAPRLPPPNALTSPAVSV